MFETSNNNNKLDELKEEKEKCEFYKMLREKTSNIINLEKLKYIK